MTPGTESRTHEDVRKDSSLCLAVRPGKNETRLWKAIATQRHELNFSCMTPLHTLVPSLPSQPGTSTVYAEASARLKATALPTENLWKPLRAVACYSNCFPVTSGYVNSTLKRKGKKNLLGEWFKQRLEPGMSHFATWAEAPYVIFINANRQKRTLLIMTRQLKGLCWSCCLSSGKLCLLAGAPTLMESIHFLVVQK